MYRYIYKVVNLLNGKSYIGQHTTHKEYDNYYGSGRDLQKDFKIYGLNNFIKGIIEYCYSQEELNEKEKYWIEKLDTINNGYNICKGGKQFPVLYGKDNPFYGKKHSEETIKKLSDCRKSRPPWNKDKKGVQKATEEQKRVASERHSGEGNWNYGRKGELSPNYGLKRNKNTIQLLSQQKIGIKNPNVGEFEIKAPDNKNYHITSGIPEFLKQHSEYKIDKWILYHAKRIGEYRGWVIKKIK